MKRLTFSVATLALGALPAVGLVATASALGQHAGGGIRHANTAHPVRVLADNGVISANAAIGSRSAIRPADDGIVNSRN